MKRFKVPANSREAGLVIRHTDTKLSFLMLRESRDSPKQAVRCLCFTAQTWTRRSTVQALCRSVFFFRAFFHVENVFCSVFGLLEEVLKKK